MKIKRMISLLLSIVMVLGMLAGCGGDQTEPTNDTLGTTQNTTPSQTQDSTTQPQVSHPDDEVFQFSDDEELLLAYEMGFVPEAMWGDLTSNVSLADFCAMLKSIIAGVDAGQVTEFEAYAGKAMTLEQPVDRGLASIALYYACDVLDLPEVTWFSICENSDCWETGGSELNNIIGDKCWDEIKNKHYEPEYTGVYPPRRRGRRSLGRSLGWRCERRCLFCYAEPQHL